MNAQDDNITPDAVPAESGSDNERLTTLMALEERIKREVAQSDQITEEKKKFAEMLEDIFTNESVYKQHSEKAKEANKLKAMTKAQIMKRPNVIELSEKIKDMKITLKELQNALSNDLVEYQQLAGVNEIEGEDGEVREIVPHYKLVKKSKRKF